jgi:hypothetical protein
MRGLCNFIIVVFNLLSLTAYSFHQTQRHCNKAFNPLVECFLICVKSFLDVNGGLYKPFGEYSYWLPWVNYNTIVSIVNNYSQNLHRTE